MIPYYLKDHLTKIKEKKDMKSLHFFDPFFNGEVLDYT